MGRRPCCSKQGLNRGAWTAMEDQILKDYIKAHGEGQWRDLPVRAGLKRCGKSCRLRWLNYLRPDIKRGNITHDEEELIIRLHNLLGNRWSLIAGRLPGRTDNEIKNYWNTNICKKLQAAQQTLSSRNNEASNENAKKSQKKTNIATMKQPSFSNSMVIRTKASRCTKVFIDVPAESPPQLQHTNPSDDQPKSSSLSEEDDNAMNNFMINLEVDENFLSQILNSDFFIDNDMGNKADLGEYNSTVTCDSSTNSDESLLFFSDELIQEMASLIESDFVGGA